jgi:radical SAM protein with 4Fe4S-binding SPASM domain
MVGITKILKKVKDKEKIEDGVREEILSLGNFSPLVVWNITKRCNLNCRHCYLDSYDKDYKGELTTKEGEELISQIKEIGSPLLLFSGGEPLLREDILNLGRIALKNGINIALSSNGTLIDEKMAEKIKEVGFQYVGVSIDGLEDTHNKFRGDEESFKKVIRGIRNLKREGIKTGIRFTINRYNYKELPELINLALDEGVERFCIYHLVYTGRGEMLLNKDISHEERKDLIKFLIEMAIKINSSESSMEILTTDNHVDAVFLYHYLIEDKKEDVEKIKEFFIKEGGCSAGRKIVNIDSFGSVHPCQFWPSINLGNIREKKLWEIWNNKENDILNMLRDRRKYLRGRCRDCQYEDICGGCRVRSYIKYGSYFMEDPACYL